MISILHVDDHPAIGFALKVLLEKGGDYTVITSSGENLIAQIHRESPQLLILDLDLKNADGLDLLPRIKQHFPLLKILVFTNQPASIYAPRTLQAGAEGFLNKSQSLSFVEPLCNLILNGYRCFPDDVMNDALKVHTALEQQGQVLSRFSDREIAVLRYLRQGKTNKEIADRLMLSNKTISTYKARMLQKSAVQDIQQLFALLDDEGEV